MTRWLALLRTPGAARLMTASLIGRLAYGIVPLALVLLARDHDHSYAVAGAIAGAYAIVLAITIPLISRLVDKHGLARVLLPLAVVFPAALVLIAVLAAADAPPVALVLAAGLAGGALPPLGATMRAQWQTLVTDPSLRESAYALESVVQEITFVVGPLIVAVIAALAGPTEALLTAGVTSAVGAVAFVTAPAARVWRAQPKAEHARATAIAEPGVRTIVLTLIMIGATFGMIEVGMPAFAEEHGNRANGGLGLAAYSLGSMAGGIWAGARDWRLAVDLRLLSSLGVLIAVTALMAAPGSMALMLAAAFVAGIPIAPTFAAAYRVIDERAPAHATTEAFGWTSTAIVAGNGAGVAAGGSLIDARGTTLAFAAAAAMVAVALLVTAARRRTLLPAG